MIARLRNHAAYVLSAGAVIALFGLLWTLLRGRLELVGELALVAGLIAVAGYVGLEPARVWRVLSGRTVRQGGNATVVSLAVVGILVLLNFLAARHHMRFDLTAERTFSLSPQTLQVLAGLEEPVHVTAYMTPGYYAGQQVRDLLKEYSNRTDRLQVEYVDPEQKPAQAREAGITRDGTVIFQLGERRQEALGSDEQEFTSALVKVTRTEEKTVYFLTGHQERDPQDSNPSGYAQVAQALERDNYRVETVNLAITSTVPSDAAVLVIAAPVITPTTEELQAVSAYVDQGGSLLVLGDPGSDITLDELLARWGVSLRRDIVVDPVASFFGDIGTPLISRFPYHDITKDLSGLTTFYPLAESIASQEPAPDGVIISPLVQTSADSWGETDRESTQVRLDPGVDTPGPLDLAVAATLDLSTDSAEEPAKSARLVLFGDADLVANDILESTQSAFGNADLFLNAANWLAAEEELISIRPNAPLERTIYLTPPQVRTVMYSSLLFLPGIVLVAGAWVWWQRR